MPVKLDVKSYPLARRDETVVDDYNGVKVADPYRWMEDPDAKETQEFVDKCNAVSKPFLDACTERSKISEKLTQLWDYPKYGCPSKHGDFYFYSYNTGLQNQSVRYIAPDPRSKGEIFIDPNTLSADGTTAIGQTKFTHNGDVMAYGLSEKGSDWTTVKFKRVPSGEHLADVLCNVKFSGFDFTRDGSGFFYSKYPFVSTDGSMQGSSTEKGKNHTLYYHKMGTKQEMDVIVAQFLKEPDYMVHGEVSDDGKYLVVGVDKGCDPNNLIFYVDLEAHNYTFTETPKLTALIDTFEAKYEFIDNDGSEWLVMSNLDAPMFKLIKVNIENNKKTAWTTVIAEDAECKLDWVVPVAGDKMVVCYEEHVKNTMYLYERNGKNVHRFDVPIGSISSMFGRRELTEMFYSFSSFTEPQIIYRVDLQSEKFDREELRRTTLKGFNADEYIVKQEFFKSKDGTKVPMYIIHHKDVSLSSGDAPTLLYGYGGFNISLLPYFSTSRVMWLNNFKGVYALANIRGGSEYGEKWHEGGMKGSKQNVFDDFQGAAEYLIESKITQPSRLCIQGGSNGGLLVAACAQQRPDLFGCVVNQVGVMDMLRYHKFTIGAAWIPEFGNPDDKEDFAHMIKYSPLHNLRPLADGKQYPSMMLLTADHDDRVVPLHSMKYVAELYNMVQKDMAHQTNPLIIRVEVRAGHGAGKPTSKIIEELTDMYSYLQRVLELKWSD